MNSAICLRRVAAASALTLLPLGCARSPQTSPAHTQATPEPPAPPRVPVTVLPAPAFAQTGSGTASIADVAERALPSVVNISLTKLSRVRAPQTFPFFFGPGFGPEGGERREQGMGSGVIVSSDGYILTNNHVVSDASEIKVTLYDRREFDAEVIGTDPKSDVAVIRLKGAPTDLRPITFGDSAALRLGDVVLAIGNPFGVGQTVTMGIVSAKGRADVGIVDYEDFIQTDAAINPGNSGGALVDTQGRLVGINTAILSRSGGYQGIGFAIPVKMATPIMESLKKYGKVTRGWLGVSIQDVDQELSTTMKLPIGRGVLIADVQNGSPASKAGLRRGDVVVKVDGQAVGSSGEFRNAIASAGANRSVSLELYRDGKLTTLTASLGESPGDAGPPARPTPGEKTKSPEVDGLTLSDLGPETRRAFGIDGSVDKGAVITNVMPGGPAARAGLRPGDVLLEVNRKPVSNAREFGDLYAKARGNVLLLVHRRGATVFLVLKR
jgi:serine protease Do